MRLYKELKNFAVFVVMWTTLIGGTLYLLFSLIDSNSLIPVVFGSISAAVGLVINLSFSYARTLNTELSDVLNARTGKLVAVVTFMIIFTIATIPSLALKYFKTSNSIFGAPLSFAVICVSVFATLSFVMLVLLAMIDLLYIANFATNADKIEVSVTNYQSSYEKFIVRLVERVSKYIN